MTGTEVREMILSKRVHVWEVAKALGVSDTTLSRWLRKDFSDAEVEKVKNAIETILTEKGLKD